VTRRLHHTNKRWFEARHGSAIFLCFTNNCLVASALATMLAVATGSGFAQSRAGSGGVLAGKDAFGDWHDDRPGLRRLIIVQDLPSIANEMSDIADVVPMSAGARPQVPTGFSAELVASGLQQARAIRVAPNGDLFVSDSSAGAVRVYRIPEGSAKPVRSETFATGLHQPYGIAFYPPGPSPLWIYIANSNSVVRFRYNNGDTKARTGPERVIECLPWTHHWTRDIVFTPDGKRLLLTVASGSNVALDMFPAPIVPDGIQGWDKTHALGSAWDSEEGRAVIFSFNPDGSDEKIYATGLRNAAGITVQPATGELWAVVNERDGLGDNTPFDYATHVREGAFYGWPWFYIGGHEDPRHKGEHDDLRPRVTAPDVLIQAHSAPLQILFYEGTNFPSEYKGSAFVTLHGSWDRSIRTGYKVVHLLFDANGRPTGEYEDFMTGFVVSDKQVWGRPVGLAVANDGSLFVTEDGNGTIWRVSYQPGGHRTDIRDER
jgi:glucose/arabinose dehydrogenase